MTRPRFILVTAPWAHNPCHDMLAEALRLGKVSPIDAGALLELRDQPGLFQRKLERIYVRAAAAQQVFVNHGGPAETGRKEFSPR